MFRIDKPGEAEVQRFVEAQRAQPFSYADVGATATRPPPGFTVDHNRVVLGRGGTAFAAAIAAVRAWRMFDMAGVHLCWPDAPIEVGATVAIVARGGPLWTLNACRIVYVVDEDGPLRRFGFAYGTLPRHVESGEERFLVEWNRGNDEVAYDLLAFSRPSRAWLNALLPLLRLAQKRFARESKAAMRRAVTEA